MDFEPFAKLIRVDRSHESASGSQSPAAAATPDSDAALVAACRAGRLDAFERLYELHGPRMKSLALHMLGNTTDAEDAVQDAFLKVHRGLGNFRGQSAFSTWIYRILVNACYDMRRRGLRRQEAPPAETEEGEMLEPPAPHANHPLRLMLERSVAQLGESQRTVFLLYEVEGFSHAEIGAMLNISEGASKTRLFEAKRELRGMLSAPAGSAGEQRP